MGLGLTKTTVTQLVEIFVKIFEVLTGGFTLYVTDLDADADVPAGTIMGYNEATRVAYVVKQAILYENEANNETAYKVLKGHLFQVGDFITFTIGGLSKTITVITTSNAAYDVITVDATLAETKSAGAVLISAASASSTCAIEVEPKGILKDSVKAVANEPVTVVKRGTVYARRLPQGAHAAVRDALTLIHFSESY